MSSFGIKSAVVVIGMPLAGKSTVARYLQNMRKSEGEPVSLFSEIEVIDLDERIERFYGPIARIFSEHGEAFFRQAERNVLERCLSLTDKCRGLIFAGGGVIQSERNRILLKERAYVVYLRVGEECLLRRLTSEEAEKRPLFQDEGFSAEDVLRRLYRERNAVYEEVADDILDADDVEVRELSHYLIGLLRKMRISENVIFYKSGKGENEMKETKVDARGLQCPLPVVKSIKALEELGGKGTVETTVDNEVAVQNLMMMAKNKGMKATRRTEGDCFVVRMEPGESDESASCGFPVEGKGSYVVVLASEFMGSGSDELGAVLMKGFIYTLTQLEEKPEALIFYNSGVKLAVDGPHLEDLKTLEKMGVELMSCGTCLDYYGLKEKLAVGNVSNMYAIADKLSKVSRVIRP